MTYEQTLDFLYTKLPMYQRVGKKAYKADLSNTIKLLEAVDNPHRKFKSVHIAGTNGKGTSAHALSAILQSAGYNVGLYTSPHLKNFTERIRINGSEIKERFVIDFIEELKPSIREIQPSFFEITVAMAFHYFKENEVDIAVIETGLGGRLDSTNVITPLVSLITNIGFDHMDLLGDTLEKIAGEKAGIIKPEVPVVIGETTSETKPVFEFRAKEKNAKLIYPSGKFDGKLPELSPDYLSLNLPGVISVCRELNLQGFAISDTHIQEGITNINSLTGLKGRFQILEESPLIIADVSHNADGLKILFEQVERIKKGNVHLIFGAVNDKDLKAVFDTFLEFESIYWTESKVPRALKVEELAIQGVMYGIEGECYKDVNEALEEAKKKVLPDDLILITGSTFHVAELSTL